MTTWKRERLPITVRYDIHLNKAKYPANGVDTVMEQEFAIRFNLPKKKKKKITLVI